MRSSLLALLLLGLPAAADAQTGPIRVEQVWSRAAPAGRVGVLYLTMTDLAAAPDRLVGIETPVAEKAELHESTDENGVRGMRPVDAIPLAPGQPVSLRPGGYHVMLMGLRRTLAEGETFPVTLRFAGGAVVEASASVAKAGALAPAGETPMQQDHGAMQH